MFFLFSLSFACKQKCQRPFWYTLIQTAHFTSNIIVTSVSIDWYVCKPQTAWQMFKTYIHVSKYMVSASCHLYDTQMLQLPACNITPESINSTGKPQVTSFITERSVWKIHILFLFLKEKENYLIIILLKIRQYL